MHLDSATIRNLELIQPSEANEPRSGQGRPTVLSVLDRTATAMGSRLLRDWLVRPLLDCGAIQARLDAVAELKDRIQQRVSLRTTLRDIQDIARLSSRVTLGVIGPRELLALKQLSKDSAKSYRRQPFFGRGRSRPTRHAFSAQQYSSTC